MWLHINHIIGNSFFFKVCAFRIIHRVFCDFIWNKNDAFIPPLFVDWYSFRDEQTVSWNPCNSYLRFLILVTLGQPCISYGIAMQSSTVKSKSKWEIENICTKYTVCLFINAKSQSISFFIGSSLHQDLYQINTTSQDGDLNVLLNCLTCIIWIGWISSDSSVGLWTVDQEFESDWGILYLLNSILDLFKSKFHIFSPFWLLKPVLLMHHNILYNQITLSIIKR